jgi:microcystin-dependent protein
MPNTFKIVSAGVPVGTIIPYAGSEAPAGWLFCDGQEVSRTEYAKLFAVIGTIYGAGDGSTTFNLPNLKGRVLVHRDNADTDFDTLGKIGGAKTHILTVDEIPSHSHSISDDGSHNHTISSDGDHIHSIQCSTSTSYISSISHTGNGGARSALTKPAGAHNHGGATGNNGIHNHGGATGNTGSGQAHNNLQPYFVINYIIRAK